MTEQSIPSLENWIPSHGETNHKPKDFADGGMELTGKQRLCFCPGVSLMVVNWAPYIRHKSLQLKYKQKPGKRNKTMNYKNQNTSENKRYKKYISILWKKILRII